MLPPHQYAAPDVHKLRATRTLCDFQCGIMWAVENNAVHKLTGQHPFLER